MAYGISSENDGRHCSENNRIISLNCAMKDLDVCDKMGAGGKSYVNVS